MNADPERWLDWSGEKTQPLSIVMVLGEFIALYQRCANDIDGAIAFSPLSQGLRTDRYLDGVPTDSRAAREGSFGRELLSDRNLSNARGLREIARGRGQTLAQMAIAWTLRDARVASALVGASSIAQLDENLAALDHLAFEPAELTEIDGFALEGGVNLWAESSNA